jgi:hypothetical protein
MAELNNISAQQDMQNDYRSKLRKRDKTQQICEETESNVTSSPIKESTKSVSPKKRNVSSTSTHVVQENKVPVPSPPQNLCPLEFSCSWFTHQGDREENQDAYIVTTSNSLNGSKKNPTWGILDGYFDYLIYITNKQKVMGV